MSPNFNDQYVFSILENWNISESYELQNIKDSSIHLVDWKPYQGCSTMGKSNIHENIHLDIEAVTSHLLSKGLQTTMPPIKIQIM